MHLKLVHLKVITFILLFTLIFITLRYLHIIPLTPQSDKYNNLPWLFSAISLIFSIISGFIIQSKWQTWNELIDATHGEISSLKQLHMLGNHFPVPIQKTIRRDIAAYLQIIIDETSSNINAQGRSDRVEAAIYKLEETVLDIDYSEHPNIGSLMFDLVRKCLDYREKRLQNILRKLPNGVKLFTISTTVSIILSSLFVSITGVVYDYVFTLIIGLLSYGIYLLIDDLDHPYRPGQWQLTKDGYISLLDEVNESIKNPSTAHSL